MDLLDPGQVSHERRSGAGPKVDHQRYASPTQAQQAHLAQLNKDTERNRTLGSEMSSISEWNFLACMLVSPKLSFQLKLLKKLYCNV